MGLPDLPQIDTENFETAMRTALDAWKAGVESKAEGDHSHGAASIVISIVANEAALGAGSTDGESKITADTGHRWTWDDTAEEWTDQELNPGSVLRHPLFHMQDQKTSGTAGGTSVAGMNDRDLNTILINETTGLSLAANEITLALGKYFIKATGPTYGSNNTRTLIRKTDDTVLLYSPNYQTAAGYDGSYDFPVSGLLDLASETVIKLTSDIQTAQGTQGLGIKQSRSYTEIYSDFKIWALDQGVS